MDYDDDQVGRVLSRREALSIFGVAGVSLLAGNGGNLGVRPSSYSRLPSCIVRPEQTEGPYFIEERLDRSDIRPDPTSGMIPDGARLDLVFHVSQVSRTECKPLAGALVDVWQCDALGRYSDVRDTNGRFNTVGQKFLRGHQWTSAAGTAAFVTVYPGWYEGRTVHIHFKIRTPRAAGGTYDFTSQLYFDDAFTDRVFAQEPYARQAGRRVRNAQDGIYRRGGEQLLLAVRDRDRYYAAAFEIGLQLD